ncbi:MAG: endonuclease/exonuclease/phosphatase family protein [Pseudomonadota bacterium]
MGIRVLSCNLRAGRASASALTDLIRRESVDVVCAQELSVALAETIAAELPYGDLGHGQIPRGNAIACRLPVEVSRISMPKRDGWIARLSPEHWDALPIAVEIVNVHISGPHTWPYFPHPVRRKTQLRALLSNHAQKKDTPHAVFGDFNASPIWPAYRRMLSRYVDGVIGAADIPTKSVRTWPYLPKLGVRGLLRIDHCFLWQLAAASVRTVEIPGSDHLGLLIDLSSRASSEFSPRPGVN